MDKVDVEQLIAKNMEKVNKKRARQGLPPKKVDTSAVTNYEEAVQKKEEEIARRGERAKEIKDSTEYYNQNAKPGSLASKANMVKMYNEKKLKKSVLSVVCRRCKTTVYKHLTVVGNTCYRTDYRLEQLLDSRNILRNVSHNRENSVENRKLDEHLKASARRRCSILLVNCLCLHLHLLHGGSIILALVFILYSHKLRLHHRRQL